MKAQIRKKKQGFTIIEVVLVLAIAGLIFLMIFIALPALQRSQRDAQRRSDISLLLSKITDFKTNNRGALPTGAPATIYGRIGETSPLIWQGFYDNYLDDNFKDPGSGELYKLSVYLCNVNTRGSRCSKDFDSQNGYTDRDIVDLKQEKRTILINIGATCNGQAAVLSNNPRSVAAQYFLEGAGVYCAST